MHWFSSLISNVAYNLQQCEKKEEKKKEDVTIKNSELALAVAYESGFFYLT